MKRALNALVPLVALLLGFLVASAEDARFGWLGVRIRDLSEQEMEEISARHGIQEGFGVMIVAVLGDTPAARSGLRSGDVVVAIRERPVIDSRSLQRVVAATSAGDEVTLIVLRNDGRRPVRVRVGAMPPEAAADRIAVEFGFSLREPFLGPEGTEGNGPAVVGAVLDRSPAERAGLRAGDLIVGVDGREALSRRAAGLALGRVSLERPLRLLVGRGSGSIPLTIESPAVSEPSRRH